MMQNGQRTEVTKPGKPDTAAPEGSPEALGALGTIPSNPPSVMADRNTPRADPPIAGESVPGAGPINPADPPSVVDHPGQNSADVNPGDGQQPVRVNPQTGEQIGLGTTDNPQQGPFVPRTFEWVPDTIDNAPTPENGAGVSGDQVIGTAGNAASAVGNAGQAAQRANNAGPSGEGDPVGHRTDSPAERFSRGLGESDAVRGMGAAGNIISAGQTASDVVEDTEHAGGTLGGAIGGAGIGAAGTYAGATLGALTGPAAPVMIPVGAAVLGYLGNEAGQNIFEPVGQAVQDLFK